MDTYTLHLYHLYIIILWTEIELTNTIKQRILTGCLGYKPRHQDLLFQKPILGQ